MKNPAWKGADFEGTPVAAGRARYANDDPQPQQSPVVTYAELASILAKTGEDMAPVIRDFVQAEIGKVIARLDSLDMRLSKLEATAPTHSEASER